MLYGCRSFVSIVGCNEVGDVDGEGCGRLSAHDSILSLSGFVQVGWFVGRG